MPGLVVVDPPNPEFEFPKPLLDPPGLLFDPNPIELPLSLPKLLAEVAELELLMLAAPPKRLAACCIWSAMGS